MYLARGPYYISAHLYSDISLFRQREITPINSEFHKFLLRTITFLLTFHFFGNSLFQYSLTPFPHGKRKS